MVHHGDPEELHGVGGDHVGVMVSGKHVVVNRCHAFWVVIFAIRASLNSLDGEEEEENLQFLDQLPHLKTEQKDSC